MEVPTTFLGESKRTDIAVPVWPSGTGPREQASGMRPDADWWAVRSPESDA